MNNIFLLQFQAVSSSSSTKKGTYPSPSPSPPAGKTATMSNSLLRSTICELERALNDSNKLLLQRDEKMQILRARNAELKKTLNREVENNKKMKIVLGEKEEIIQEFQKKITESQQQIDELYRKLSQHEKVEEIEEEKYASSTKSSLSASKPTTKATTTETFDINGYSEGDGSVFATAKKKISHLKGNEVNCNDVPSTTQKSSRSSSVTSRRQNEHQQNTRKESDEDDCHRVLSSDEPKKNNTTNNERTNDLQDVLRIKFLRDAFFYYMIGFHPDEQINAILAILEYGDRRQELVREAHDMRKLGKNFNVSQVSSRGHSFVQEQIR